MKKLFLFLVCLLIFPLAASSAVNQVGQNLQSNYAGSGNANGQTFPISGYLVATFSVSGTFSATIVPEVSLRSDGTAWNGLTCFQLDGTTPITAFTVPGSWRCNITGHALIRARVSSYSSGSITVDVVVSDAGTPITKFGGGGGGGGVNSVSAANGVETTTGTPISSNGTIRGATYVNDQGGTTYTLDVNDRGKLVSFSNSSGVAVSAVGNIAGWYTDIENRGIGTVTITPTVGLIDGAASLAVGPSTGIRIFTDGSNYFTLRGGGSGGAPVDATFLVTQPNGVLTNEVNLGALATGALIGTVSGGISTISAFSGLTCTNQVVRILPAALTGGTCQTITSSYVDSSIAVTGASNSWGDGITQTFNPNDTSSGFNFGANANPPSSPVNGDAYYDSNLTLFQFRENGAWKGLGIQVEADTLQSVFARGKEITGANSFANAALFGDGTNKVAIFWDATIGAQVNCAPAGVNNDCNYLRNLNPGKKWGAKDRNGTEIFTLTEAVGSGALTNITLDAEASGNTLTIPTKVSFPTVGCQGTSGSLLWDTNATLQPTATCTAGSTNTTLIQGYADFPDVDGDYSLQNYWRLPSDWSGAIDMQIFWKAAATTGNVVWQVATMCTADAEIEDVAWNTADKFTADTAKGTTLQLNDVSKTGITTTGCAAGELLHLKVFRNRTDTNDTITGVVSLKNVEMTLRRAE